MNIFITLMIVVTGFGFMYGGGYITTSGPLTSYQRARGIDTSKRKQIE